MDLGIVPGTQVTVEMHSPSGDPTAYRIRDTIIALRKEQAQHIRIERMPQSGVRSEYRVSMGIATILDSLDRTRPTHYWRTT